MHPPTSSDGRRTTVQVRRATESDRRTLAELAAGLQTRPEHHVPYLGLDPDTIAAEMVEDVDDWTEASAVAEVDGRTVGWLMGSVDHDMGRVWWFGPFVDADDPAAWRRVADRLDEMARDGLTVDVTEEEYAFDTRHAVGPTWAAERGFAADPGSAVMTLDHAIGPTEITVRSATPGDADTVGVLHDRLFPNTHTRGAVLVSTTEPRIDSSTDHPTGPIRVRLVAEDDGELLGYVAVERQPDGSGYIDFLGVAPAYRRRGIGAQLVRAGVAALAELGCERFHLTVREENAGARALYLSLGFEEERILRPFRRGFSLP